MKSQQHGIGRFGTEAEFNNLFVGRLVRPETKPGLRSAFRVVAGPSGVPWSQTVMSLYPNLTTVRVNGAEWHTGDPLPSSLVVVPGSEPGNLIVTLPRLVEAPGNPIPVLPLETTREEWLAAGLNPDTQPLFWQFPNGLDTEVRVHGSVTEWQYEIWNGRRSARIRQHAGFVDYTYGFAVEPGPDFFVLRGDFGLIVLDEALLPAGRYVFRNEAWLIPRSLAYRCDAATNLAECFQNRHLVNNPQLPHASIEIIGEVPNDLLLPSVSSVIPNSANDTLYIIGQRLDRTTGVMFSPGVPGEFVIESDTQLRVGVPPVAEPGLLVVETTFGWVLTQSPSNPTSRLPSPALRPRTI